MKWYVFLVVFVMSCSCADWMEKGIVVLQNEAPFDKVVFFAGDRVIIGIDPDSLEVKTRIGLTSHNFLFTSHAHLVDGRLCVMLGESRLGSPDDTMIVFNKYGRVIKRWKPGDGNTVVLFHGKTWLAYVSAFVSFADTETLKVKTTAPDKGWFIRAHNSTWENFLVFFIEKNLNYVYFMNINTFQIQKKSLPVSLPIYEHISFEVVGNFLWLCQQREEVGKISIYTLPDINLVTNFWLTNVIMDDLTTQGEKLVYREFFWRGNEVWLWVTDTTELSRFYVLDATTYGLKEVISLDKQMPGRSLGIWEIRGNRFYGAGWYLPKEKWGAERVVFVYDHDARRVIKYIPIR